MGKIKKLLGHGASIGGAVLGMGLGRTVAVQAAAANVLPPAATWPKLRAWTADAIVAGGAVVGFGVGGYVGRKILGKIG